MDIIQAKNLKLKLDTGDFSFQDKDNIYSELRKVLWNEIEIAEIYDKYPILESTILFYFEGLFKEADFKAMLNILFLNNLISDLEIVLIGYLIDFKDNMDEWVNSLLKIINDLFPVIINISYVIEVYEAISGNMVSDLWRSVESKVQSINKRPEFIVDILDNAEQDEILRIYDFLDIDNRVKLTDYYIRRYINSKKYNSYDDVTNDFEFDNFMRDFPRSINVLGSKASELPPQTVDMDIIARVPQKLVRDVAMKFAYSSPDIPQKFKLYFPGGDGIGHSAIILKTNEGLLLFDFGLSVLNTTLPRWYPILHKLDAIFLTHAHLDHSGSLPLLYNKLKTPWFGTRETNILTQILWSDTRKILSRNVNNNIINNNYVLKNLTSEANILNTAQSFNEIKIGEEISILPDVSVRAYNAGHLFGSVGYEITVGNKKLFYTGDFNTQGSFMLDKANFPKDNDITIFDGTYYARYETMVTDPEIIMRDILDESSRVIIPAFSIGRSHEILYLLKNMKLNKTWNVYLTGMAATVANNLNLAFNGENNSLNIEYRKSINENDFVDNSIVITGQGMLQVGTSRKLLEYTKHDNSTSVVLTGYQSPNTLGYHIINNREIFNNKYQQRVFKLRLSGHSPPDKLDRFIDEQENKKIMVHSPAESRKKLERDDIQIPSTINKI